MSDIIEGRASEPGDHYVDRQGDRWEFNGSLYECEWGGSQPTVPPGLSFLWNEYEEEAKEERMKYEKN